VLTCSIMVVDCGGFSEVAEMGDRLATIDMGRKVRRASVAL